MVVVTIVNSIHKKAMKRNRNNFVFLILHLRRITKQYVEILCLYQSQDSKAKWLMSCGHLLNQKGYKIKLHILMITNKSCSCILAQSYKQLSDSLFLSKHPRLHTRFIPANLDNFEIFKGLLEGCVQIIESSRLT